MRIAALLCSVALLAGCRGAVRAASQPSAALARTELSHLAGSAVTLHVLIEAWWGTELITNERSGSGFVMDHQGARVVVTAAHVVQGATEIVVIDDQGRVADATQLWAFDDKADVAVLQVPNLAPNIRALRSGKRPAVGEEVMLVSSPLGYSTTVSFGTVSAHRPEARAVQLAAGISPGSSGGLVADRRGHAIGVLRSKAPAELGGENIALATPIAFVLDSLADKKPLSLSARPDRRKLRPVSRRQLLTTAVTDPETSYAGEARVVVDSGDRPLEHICARSSDREAYLAIREAEGDDSENWRGGVGGACATVWGQQEVEVWIGTKYVGRKVELIISRQK